MANRMKLEDAVLVIRGRAAADPEFAYLLRASPSQALRQVEEIPAEHRSRVIRAMGLRRCPCAGDRPCVDCSPPAVWTTTAQAASLQHVSLASMLLGPSDAVRAQLGLAGNTYVPLLGQGGNAHRFKRKFIKPCQKFILEMNYIDAQIQHQQQLKSEASQDADQITGQKSKGYGDDGFAHPHVAGGEFAEGSEKAAIEGEIKQQLADIEATIADLFRQKAEVAAKYCVCLNYFGFSCEAARADVIVTLNLGPPLVKLNVGFQANPGVVTLDPPFFETFTLAVPAQRAFPTDPNLELDSFLGVIDQTTVAISGAGVANLTLVVDGAPLHLNVGLVLSGTGAPIALNNKLSSLTGYLMTLQNADLSAELLIAFQQIQPNPFLFFPIPTKMGKPFPSP